MTLDRLVVARSAAHGLLLGAPAAVVNGILADQDPKPKAAMNATLLALLVAFGISGLVAGREAPVSPAAHGALAGLLTFALVQLIGVLARLDRGDDVAIGQALVLGLVATAVGAGASGLGARRRAEP